jgi:selenocysteine lyase/cysteine desulfurase
VQERTSGAPVEGCPGDEGGPVHALGPSPWRDLFPIVERCVFLDHAGVAPISTRVRDAIDRFATEATAELHLRYPHWEERAEDVRRRCARLIGCDPHQVAFVKNTSEGISLIAEGLDLDGGDVVVVADREFPTNVYPWWGLRRLGVEVRMLDTPVTGLTPEVVADALDARVRIVALSAVAYGTGDRLDLPAIAALCREHGALFVVDGIQAVGALRVDMRAAGLDAIAADGHKWLCAPEGCGLLAVSDRLLERLRPSQLGWKSVMESSAYYPYHFRLRRDAAVLEPGSLNLLGVHALGAAVDLALEVGMETIERRLTAITARVEAGLRARGLRVLGRRGDDAARADTPQGGIVTFVPNGAPERVRQELWARGVVTKVRFGGIRVAPHHYQDGRDVDAFLAALDQAEAALA